MQKVLNAIIGVAMSSTLMTFHAVADPLLDWDKQRAARQKQQASAMNADIGKSFSISNPQGKGLELCPSTSERFAECRRISNITFTVKSVALGKSPLVFYGVELVGGRKGFIYGAHNWAFLEPDLSGERRTQIVRCESQGPSIGMLTKDVLACWGPPDRTNSTTTAAGSTQQLVYEFRGNVYLRSGIVTAIQTQR
jgi:hypothetical protein